LLADLLPAFLTSPSQGEYFILQMCGNGRDTADKPAYLKKMQFHSSRREHPQRLRSTEVAEIRFGEEVEKGSGPQGQCSPRATAQLPHFHYQRFGCNGTRSKP
jgi:hypothetical protein